ncbi:hypothetical protein MASR2M48_08090 [Spirochaetota bacterium]
MSSAIKTMDFGVCSDGTIPRLFILDNGSMRVGISEYGAIICSAIVPDVSSGEIDLLLGSSTLAGLCARHPYMGSTVGRFANRIAGARFTLDGTEYVLGVLNNGKNSFTWRSLRASTVVYGRQSQVRNQGRLVYA